MVYSGGANMQLQFLCPKHTDWVYSHPEQAIHVMARDEMQGNMLMYSGQLSEAVPYLGCAFDIAVILLEIDGGTNTKMAKKIMSLASMLEETYFHLRLPLYRNAIIDRAHAVVTASESIVEHGVTWKFTA